MGYTFKDILINNLKREYDSLERRLEQHLKSHSEMAFKYARDQILLSNCLGYIRDSLNDVEVTTKVLKYDIGMTEEEIISHYLDIK